MESAFRWCFGILAIAAFQVGCCRIELHGGPSHLNMNSRAVAHEGHGVEVFAGNACVDGDCHAAASSGCGDGCGVNGLDHLFNGSLHSHWKHTFSRCGSKLACSGACGEVYWDEHINDPPVCDPCGPQGAWGGGNCGTCRPWYSRMRDLWGYRYESPECSGCSACGMTSSRAWAGEGREISGECAHCDDGQGTHVQHGETVVPNQMQQSSPTPAQPKVAPTPDANARRRALPSGGSVAGNGSKSEKSHGPSHRTASVQRTATSPESSPVAYEADGVPRQLQVQTVNGQRRLVARSK